MVIKFNLIIVFLFFSLLAHSQVPELPALHGYDSTTILKYKDKTVEKHYWRKGDKVLSVDYGLGIDSFYRFKEDDIVIIVKFFRDKVDYNSYNLRSDSSWSVKYDYNNVILEQGWNYLIKKLDGTSIDQWPKYKIGQWLYEDSKIVDYDKYEIYGKKINRVHGKEFRKYISKARKEIRKIYGSKFMKQHVRFNMGKSVIYSYEPRRSGFGSSRGLSLTPLDSIVFCDFAFDIILADKRYMAIELRIDSKYDLVGKASYQYYGNTVYNMTKGFDFENNGKFDTKITNWRKTASDNNFNWQSENFNTRFEWESENNSEFNGSLWFIIEEKLARTNSKNGVHTEILQMKINPWTGESRFVKANEGIFIEGIE